MKTKLFLILAYFSLAPTEEPKPMTSTAFANSVALQNFEAQMKLLVGQIKSFELIYPTPVLTKRDPKINPLYKDTM